MADTANKILSGHSASGGNGLNTGAFTPELALRLATRAFESLGAHVCIGPERENLVRTSVAGEPAGFVVEAQGLENLIHELVHALVQGKLDDDHGFPYDQIPLDMGRAAHRAQLFEELACCTLSCAFAPIAQRDAWFAEQAEILPVFYGLEAKPHDWRRLVSRITAAHPGAFVSVLEQSSASLAQALDGAAHELGESLDARGALCGPGATQRSFEARWRAYLQSTPV